MLLSPGFFRGASHVTKRKSGPPTRESERERERVEGMPASSVSPWRCTRAVRAKGRRKIQPKFWSVETVSEIANCIHLIQNEIKLAIQFLKVIRLTET